MTKYILANVISSGPVNWKLPLTAPGQPAIGECAMISVDTEDDSFGIEMTAPNAFNLNIYSDMIGKGAIVVGHSVDFHAGALRAAMIDLGFNPYDGHVRTICTMLALTGVAPKANGRRGWPTFGEACHWAGVTRAGRESAEDNARCLLEVFRAMERAGVVPEPKIWKDRTEK